MTDLLQSLLQAGNLQTNNLSPSSRYYRVGTATMMLGQTNVVYLKRRFITTPSQSSDAREYRVRESDRLDNLAASVLGDAEQFWQIADLNTVIQPELLTAKPGTWIRIALTSDGKM